MREPLHYHTAQNNMDVYTCNSEYSYVYIRYICPAHCIWRMWTFHISSYTYVYVDEYLSFCSRLLFCVLQVTHIKASIYTWHLATLITFRSGVSHPNWHHWTRFFSKITLTICNTIKLERQTESRV